MAEGMDTENILSKESMKDKDEKSFVLRRSTTRRRIFGVSVTALLIAAIAVAVVVTTRKSRRGGTADLLPSTVVVETDCGKVEGLVVEGLQNGTCHEFINIPYAVPPVRDLRWKRPILLSKDKSRCWKGTYPANIRTTKICPQFQSTPPSEIIGDEDCLYLSVRSPNITGKLPVLFWIHGGGLVSGYNGVPGYFPDDEVTLSLEVVTVSVNYRLGLLGFLSLQELWNTKPDEEVYGNFGAMDLIVALQWVKNNIARFGGDPNVVAIQGQSAGAGLVMALVGSPLANGLFHRAIAESPIWPRKNYSDVARESRSVYLSRIGCSEAGSDKMRQCLYNASMRSIVNASFDVGYLIRGMGFPKPHEMMRELLVIDPYVLPQPLSELKFASFKPKQNLPVIISSMAQEIGNTPEYQFKDDEWNRMHQVMNDSLSLFNVALVQPVFKLYPNRTNDNITLVPQFVYETLVSDIRWTCIWNRVASQVGESENRSVYRLYVTHHPSTPYLGRRFSYHGWDTAAFFGKFIGFNVTSHELSFRDILRSTLKVFTVDGSVPYEWSKYPNTTALFTNASPWIEYRHGSVQQQQCNFWLRFM